MNRLLHPIETYRQTRPTHQPQIPHHHPQKKKRNDAITPDGDGAEVVQDRVPHAREEVLCVYMYMCVPLSFYEKKGRVVLKRKRGRKTGASFFWLQ